jgi:NAD(P)-dependent dehydrogenase (short-subunit alcohol dehydrogenase family)
VALVTGATGGIGREIAGALVSAGWQVFGAGRELDPGDSIPGVTLFEMDLTSPESVQAAVDQVLSRAGRIDALVNNAGVIGPPSASEEMRLEDTRSLFDVNFFGAVAATNAVLPHMRAQGSGAVIFVSSVGGMVAAMPFYTFYSASKHALEAYAAGLRLEVRQFGIQVALIEPGYTQTSILVRNQEPANPLPLYASPRRQVFRLDQAGLRFGTPPSQVARAILSVLRQPDPALHNLVGSDSAWMVLLHRLLPGPIFERLVYWMFFQWQDNHPAGEITSPQQLGLRRVLFHRPTRDFTIRAGLAAASACAGFGLTILCKMIRRRRLDS